MHIISFDASPRQVSKLRNGHAVRIKRGSGFNLVVHPENYKIVSRAFTKNKGVELKLSPEELETNMGLSPEQHEELGEDTNKELFEHLPFAQGGSIFHKIGKKINKALHSKTAKHIGRELRPLSREIKKIGKEMAHQKIAEAHMAGAERYGDNEQASRLMNIGADIAHSNVQGGSLKSIGRQINKALHSKTAKTIGRELKPLSRALKSTARDLLHQKLAEMHQTGASSQYGEDPRMAQLMNIGAMIGHEKIGGMGIMGDVRSNVRHLTGSGMGTGMGTGMNAHDALRFANMATANANHQLAKMHNSAVHGQITQPPIKRYWDDAMSPPSRGYGLHNHMNLIRGRGSMLSQDDILPPALQSQPYGANWHMQFFLPPQYHRYNDGTEVEGRGLYI